MGNEQEYSRQERTQAIIDMLAGRTSVAEVAERFGVHRDEVDQWKLLFLDGARRTAPADKPKRWRSGRRGLALGGVACATVLGLWTASAWSQTACTSTLPSPMTTFCADTPARANEVNDNFQQIVDWVEQKVGTVGDGNVTVPGNLQVDGTLLTLEDKVHVSAETNTTAGNGANDEIPLGASNGRRFCFLTQVFFGPEENSICEVHVVAGEWVATASAWTNTPGEQSRTGCDARCISW